MLPHRLTLPLFFNKQELLELQASPAVGMSEDDGAHLLGILLVQTLISFSSPVDSLCQIKNIARLYTILHKQLRVSGPFNSSG